MKTKKIKTNQTLIWQKIVSSVLIISFTITSAPFVSAQSNISPTSIFPRLLEHSGSSFRSTAFLDLQLAEIRNYLLTRRTPATADLHKDFLNRYEDIGEGYGFRIVCDSLTEVKDSVWYLEVELANQKTIAVFIYKKNRIPYNLVRPYGYSSAEKKKIDIAREGMWVSGYMPTDLLDSLRIVTHFLAERDCEELNSATMTESMGCEKADILLLFGNDDLETIEKAAELYNKGLVKKIVASGGKARLTIPLINNMRKSYRYRQYVENIPLELTTVNTEENWRNLEVTESFLMKQILKYCGVNPDDIVEEPTGTNTGLNVRNTLPLLGTEGIKHDTFILMQKPLQQKRAVATFDKEAGDEKLKVKRISYAPYVLGREYIGKNREQIKELLFEIIEEIDKLSDYGPKGKGFHTGVDISGDIGRAYAVLRTYFYELEVQRLENRYEEMDDPDKPFDNEGIKNIRGRFETKAQGDPYPAQHPVSENVLDGIIGYPFYQGHGTGTRIREIQDFFRGELGLAPDTLFLTPERELHTTVFSVQDPRDSETILTPDQKLSELKKINSLLSNVSDFEIEFNKVIVTETGEIVLVGIPKSREFFKIRRLLDKRSMDAVHVSLGRFVKKPTMIERKEIVTRLNAWIADSKDTWGGDAIVTVKVERDSWKVVVNETNWYDYKLSSYKDYLSANKLAKYIELLDTVNNLLKKDLIKREHLPGLVLSEEFSGDSSLLDEVLREVLFSLKYILTTNPGMALHVNFLFKKKDPRIVGKALIRSVNGMILREHAKRLAEFLKTEEDLRNSLFVLLGAFSILGKDLSDQAFLGDVLKVMKELINHPEMKAEKICDKLGLKREQLIRIYQFIKENAFLKDCLIYYNRYPGFVSDVEDLFEDVSYLRNCLDEYRVTYPKIVEFQPGEVCPNDCVFCYSRHDRDNPYIYRDRDYGKKPLTPGRATQLVNQFANGGTKEIWISGGMEPLTARPVTRAILKAAKERGLKTRLYTNGRHFNDEMMEVVLNCDWIRFSIGGVTSGIYDAVNRPRDEHSFNKMIARMRRLIALRDERKSKLEIGMSYLVVPEPSNYKQIIEAADFARKIGLNFFAVRTDMAKLVRKFTNEEIEDILRQKRELEERIMNGYYGSMRIDIRGIQKEELEGRQILFGIEPAASCRARSMKVVINPYGIGYLCEFLGQPLLAEPLFEVGDFSVEGEGVDNVLTRSQRLVHDTSACSGREIDCHIHEFVINAVLEKLDADSRFGVDLLDQPFSTDYVVYDAEDFIIKYNKQNVPLVVGGTGYIGKHFIDQQLQEGNEVAALVGSDRTDLDFGSNDKFYPIKREGLFDKDNLKTLEQLVEQAPVVYLFTDEDKIRDSDNSQIINALREKALMTGIVCALAKKYGKKVVFISSAHMYLQGDFRNANNSSVNEGKPIEISNETRRKIAEIAERFKSGVESAVSGEELVMDGFIQECMNEYLPNGKKAYSGIFDNDINDVVFLLGESFIRQMPEGKGVILRPTNVYGGRQTSGVIDEIKESILADGIAWASGNTRNFIYIDDVIKAISTAGRKEFRANETFIIASSERPVTMSKLAREIAMRLGEKYEPDRVRESGVKTASYAPAFNIYRAHEQLDLVPVTLNEGLNRMLGYPQYLQTVAMVGVGRWGKGAILKTLLERYPWSRIIAFARSNYHEIYRMSKDSANDNLTVYPAGHLDSILANEIFPVDAVFVSTQFENHYEIVKKSLLAGRHVFVEKAFTKTAEQAEELISLARKRGLILMVGYQNMYNLHINALKNVVYRTRIGKIKKIELRMQNPMPERGIDTTSDVVEDIGVHMMSIVQLLLGDSEGIEEYDIERHTRESAHITFKYKGVDIVIKVDRDYPGEMDRRIEVEGTESKVVLNYKDNVFEEGSELIFEEIPDDLPWPVALEFEGFMNGIFTGTEPRSSARRTLWISKLVDRLREIESLKVGGTRRDSASRDIGSSI